MKVYSPADIRNVAVAGHGSSGKTSLVAGCLYAAGVGNRLGRVDEGTTLTDYDPEEIERKISTSTGLAFMERGKTKINLLDTPGKGIFIQDARNSMRVAEAVLIVVDAVAGVEVQTEKVFQFAQEFDLPVAFVLNKLDRDNADFERGISLLQEHFGRTVIPMQIPVGKEKNFNGVIDLIELKASRYEPNGDGKGTPIEIPESLKEAAEQGHETIVEMVAEGDDQLMEQFFDQGTIPNEDLVPGLKRAIAERLVFPVYCYSALLNVGSGNLVDALVDYLPSPDESKFRLGGNGEDSGQRQGKENEPVSAYVFKTVADPFAGRLSYLKVASGVIENDATLSNFNQGPSERLSHLSVPQGKSAVEVSRLFPGDIGVVAKLKDTVTGNTLGDKEHPV
ncbi:MAG: GTP-binding protein, partial [Acidobacteriota bacterium]|nr:GTP-binding protein [Acidobacteriota bacterium]